MNCSKYDLSRWGAPVRQDRKIYPDDKHLLLYSACCQGTHACHFCCETSISLLSFQENRMYNERKVHCTVSELMFLVFQSKGCYKWRIFFTDISTLISCIKNQTQDWFSIIPLFYLEIKIEMWSHILQNSEHKSHHLPEDVSWCSVKRPVMVSDASTQINSWSFKSHCAGWKGRYSMWVTDDATTN